MAKIVGGVPPFVGTRDNLTIYLMNGDYIVRSKSSLTGKRVKRDPAFAKTMKYAGWLKQGARIASVVYRQIPADERAYKQYRELTGNAMTLLKEGFDTGDVIVMLEAAYLCRPMESSAGCGTEACREYAGECISGSSSEYSKEYSREYSRKYSSEYTGKYCGECTVKYRSRQTRVYVGKYGSRSVYKCNGKRCCECNCIRAKDNDKCANEKECKDAHEYMRPCYCFGDRPRRAVQVGITGCSYLKYADATDGGLIEIQKPIRPLRLIARNFKELQPVIPTCNREQEGQC
jgi:hypothetical protein